MHDLQHASKQVHQFFAQIGWVLKGLVYAIIGGLACQSSAEGVQKVKGADISPQVHSFAFVPGHYDMCNVILCRWSLLDRVRQVVYDIAMLAKLEARVWIVKTS